MRCCGVIGCRRTTTVLQPVGRRLPQAGLRRRLRCRREARDSFLYPAFILDVYSRKVVEWAMESHLRTELVVDALQMAVRRKPRLAWFTIPTQMHAYLIYFHTSEELDNRI